MSEQRQAQHLCEVLDSLIVGTQMALGDARWLTGNVHHALPFKLQLVRQYLFEAKSELMDFGIASMTTPRMPPDEGQFSWVDVS